MTTVASIADLMAELLAVMPDGAVEASILLDIVFFLFVGSSARRRDAAE